MSDILNDGARGQQYKALILLVAIFPASWRKTTVGVDHTNIREN